MGDILSQSEIDELLHAFNSGDITQNDVVQSVTTSKNKRNIKTLDFRRPNKFAKDQLKTLHIIHENFARLLTNFLSGYLRTLVQVDVLSVEEMTYNEFNNSISNPSIMGIVDFTPLQGSIIMELSPHIAFTLIDRILGGRGSSMEKVRGFTEIELVIIERIIIQMLNLMRDPWENVVDIRPRLEKIETNSQFAQIIPPNEMIALISFNTKIGEAESIINLCIPFQVVESIVNKLSTKFWFSTKELAFSEENKEVIQRQIETTRIPIRGILGTANVTVKDVMEMQLGDVITLDTHVSDDIPVYIGGLNKFKGRAGVKNNRLALKITSVLKEEED